MNSIYIILSFTSFLGTLLLLFSFRKIFKKLSVPQKLSIIVITISNFLPIIIGFIILSLS